MSCAMRYASRVVSSSFAASSSSLRRALACRLVSEGRAAGAVGSGGM